MLQQYHSELGEKPQYEDKARYNAFIGKWAVRTNKQLSGQGIKFYEIDEQGRNFYYVTQKAFDKLSKTMDLSQELLFD
jgi:hypothetical protein